MIGWRGGKNCAIKVVLSAHPFTQFATYFTEDTIKGSCQPVPHLNVYTMWCTSQAPCSHSQLLWFMAENNSQLVFSKDLTSSLAVYHTQCQEWKRNESIRQITLSPQGGTNSVGQYVCQFSPLLYLVYLTSLFPQCFTWAKHLHLMFYFKET